MSDTNPLMTFEYWDTNVRPNLPRYRDAGRSDRRAAWEAGGAAKAAELLDGAEVSEEHGEFMAECRRLSEMATTEFLQATPGEVSSIVLLYRILDTALAEARAVRKRLGESEEELNAVRLVVDGDIHGHESHSILGEQVGHLKDRLVEAEQRAADAENLLEHRSGELADVKGELFEAKRELEKMRHAAQVIRQERDALRDLVSENGLYETSPNLPDVQRIRSLAKARGYALGVHGSLKRDCDLIAVPWDAECVEPERLVRELCEELDARVIGEPEDKPCGRRAWIIQEHGWVKAIDLSIVLPRESDTEAELTRLRTALHQERERHQKTVGEVERLAGERDEAMQVAVELRAGIKFLTPGALRMLCARIDDAHPWVLDEDYDPIDGKPTPGAPFDDLGVTDEMRREWDARRAAGVSVVDDE